MKLFTLFRLFQQKNTWNSLLTFILIDLLVESESGFPCLIAKIMKKTSKILTTSCHGKLPGQSFVLSGYGRYLFQVEDHSGSRPHSFSGFPRFCFGMFPERFRSASVSVGSREIRLIHREHPKCVTMSC